MAENLAYNANGSYAPNGDENNVLIDVLVGYLLDCFLVVIMEQQTCFHQVITQRSSTKIANLKRLMKLVEPIQLVLA